METLVQGKGWWEAWSSDLRMDHCFSSRGRKQDQLALEACDRMPFLLLTAMTTRSYQPQLQRNEAIGILSAANVSSSMIFH
jgi:transposase InsO family protein